MAIEIIEDIEKQKKQNVDGIDYTQYHKAMKFLGKHEERLIESKNIVLKAKGQKPMENMARYYQKENQEEDDNQEDKGEINDRKQADDV